MLTHVHTSSTLCDYQVRSKGEEVADLEKEKEAKAADRMLASVRPDAGRLSPINFKTWRVVG